jgi:hydrogenase expression/formation protein HypC
MCLAIPGQVIELHEDARARVRFGASDVLIDLSFVEGVNIGDYVIAHCGFALTVLDEEEAAAQLALWREFEQSRRADEIR